MTTLTQKQTEIKFANKASKLLRENWQIEIPENEEDWPDLIIKKGTSTFGLEVTNLYLDRTKKGSLQKELEVKNQRTVKNLADEYYSRCSQPIQVSLSGGLDCTEILLDAIIKELPEMEEWEQRRIEVHRTSVLYIKKLPLDFGEYRRWSYPDNHVGFVSFVTKQELDYVIREKEKKLSKYLKNLSDVSLLIVSDRDFNSGKARLKEEIYCDPCGFNNVYYYSDPDQLCILK